MGDSPIADNFVDTREPIPDDLKHFSDLIWYFMYYFIVRVFVFSESKKRYIIMAYFIVYVISDMSHLSHLPT